MSASVESQRLISLSLGKIAQSRGQRGGINLHKNLLVATVLHKARAAYMMENYNYQCLQRKQQEQQNQQETKQTSTDLSCTESPSIVSQICPSPSPMESEVGQPSTPVTSEVENRSTPPEESRVVVSTDKENHPPTESTVDECCDERSTDHLAAARQLARDAMTSDKLSKQQTSGSPTCNTPTVLKRRRDNPQTTHSEDSPAIKKAKITNEVPSLSLSLLTPRPQSPCQFAALNGDTSDESDSDSEEVPMVQQADTPQITNLVSIFNSGFAGLCANKVSEHDHFTPLRPESPTPSHRILCSSEVGRLDALYSTVMLSA